MDDGTQKLRSEIDQRAEPARNTLAAQTVALPHVEIHQSANLLGGCKAEQRPRFTQTDFHDRVIELLDGQAGNVARRVWPIDELVSLMVRACSCRRCLPKRQWLDIARGAGGRSLHRTLESPRHGCKVTRLRCESSYGDDNDRR